MTQNIRPLRAFLCHASSDKLIVQELYERLISNGIDAWLDIENLLPGQDWKFEISKAVRNSDVVIVCLSQNSITKEGFIQKEINFALEIAEEKLEGTIFIIPVKLEPCDVPRKISNFHWVELFSNDGYKRLIQALQVRAQGVGATINAVPPHTEYQKTVTKISKSLNDADSFRFNLLDSANLQLIPTSQFRKHTAVLGSSGSGCTNVLNWLVHNFWKEHKIPCLAINYWRGISPRLNSIDGLNQYQLESGTDFITNEGELSAKINQIEAHIDFDKLLKSPTIFDLKIKNFGLTRMAFKLFWEKLVQKINFLPLSESLNLIVAVDEIDEFDIEFQPDIFSNHLRDFRKCGIGVLFSRYRLDSLRLREVRNFILLQNTIPNYRNIQEILGMESPQRWYQELEPGKGIFLAQGLVKPCRISIPYLP